MVGPEGRKSIASINSLECQTGENRPIDSKQLFADLSNQPPDTPESKSPAEPASINGAGLRNVGKADDTPEASGDQAWEYWDWERDRADIIVPTQMAIAAYRAPRGMIAIRQEHDEFEEQDSVILVHPQHIPALIERLQRLAGGK